jgi:hypothetical protein
MSVELAGVAAVEPLLGADLATDIAREAFGFVRRAEGELKGVVGVVVVAQRQWFGCTGDV